MISKMLFEYQYSFVVKEGVLVSPGSWCKRLRKATHVRDRGAPACCVTVLVRGLLFVKRICL